MTQCILKLSLKWASIYRTTFFYIFHIGLPFILERQVKIAMQYSIGPMKCKTVNYFCLYKILLYHKIIIKREGSNTKHFKKYSCYLHASNNDNFSSSI